jgi:PPOX class probable F420-dependent enzyme
VSPADVRERVARARVGRLATLDPDGRPNLVPLCYALAGETLYTAVDEKPKRSRQLRRVENIQERPDVTVLVDHYEDDWSCLWWVRLRGKGRVIEDVDEKERALALLKAKYEQYREQPPSGPFIAVDIEEWRGWASEAGVR